MKISAADFAGSADTSAAASSSTEMKQITLNDELFEQLQNSPFHAVGLKLRAYLKALTEQENVSIDGR